MLGDGAEMRERLTVWIFVFVLGTTGALVQSRLRFSCPDKLVCWEAGAGNSTLGPWGMLLLCLVVGAGIATVVLFIPPKNKD